MISVTVTAHKRRPVLRAVCRVAAAVCWVGACLALILCAPFAILGAAGRYFDIKAGRL